MLDFHPTEQRSDCVTVHVLNMYSLCPSVHWIANVSVYPRMTSYGAVIAKVDGSIDMCYGEYEFVVPGSFN
jgi:hypothetical protein